MCISNLNIFIFQILRERKKRYTRCATPIVSVVDLEAEKSVRDQEKLKRKGRKDAKKEG